MKIGVFDSGIGGKAIVERIRRELPDAEIAHVDDAIHMPYSSRTQDEIISLTDAAIQPLLNGKCDVIVLACNTATAAAIETLRTRYPKQQFIGLEPMVKTAASMTKSKIIAICATPYTLKSQRYQKLKDKYATDITVLEPNCSEWAMMIEENKINDKKISQIIKTVCNDGADVIVLACTHYHWIKKQIQSLAGSKVTVIDPSEAIARRVRYLVSENILDYQNQLQSEATELLLTTVLLELLGRLGNVTQTGSSVTGLMVYPDIDFSIQSNDLNVNKAIELTPIIFSKLKATALKIADFNTPGHKDKGYYFGCEFPFKEKIWHIDATIDPPGPIITNPPDFNKWINDMSEEQRKNILMLKKELIYTKRYVGAKSQPPYTFRSSHLYEAVLKGNAKTIADVELYFS